MLKMAVAGIVGVGIGVAVAMTEKGQSFIEGGKKALADKSTKPATPATTPVTNPAPTA